jgi:rubrerythrin
MTQEHEATLAVLQTALKMEEDGKEFYTKAAKACPNKLGAHLFKKLAEEEDIHREIFKAIFNKIKKEKQWPDTGFTPDQGRELKTVFAAAMENMDKQYKPAQAELDAVKTGMEMENKTLAFYRERSAKTGLYSEKHMYVALTEQESDHFRILQDYYEFLSDPAGYFVKTERTSVDGG